MNIKYNTNNVVRIGLGKIITIMITPQQGKWVWSIDIGDDHFGDCYTPLDTYELCKKDAELGIRRVVTALIKSLQRDMA